jgi:uncharacterized protein
MNLFSPTGKQERLAVVDALRGLALMAIIIANIPFAYESMSLYSNRSVALGSADTDKALSFLFHMLIDKKFVAIFSLLFGFGCYIQLQRAEEKQVSFQPYFIRRMLLLLLIGCVHAYLFWQGDIIRDYALCGFFLLLVYHWPAKRILLLGGVFAVFLTAIVFITNGALGLQQYPYDLALFTEHPVASTYGRYLQINATIDPFVNFVQDSPLTLVFAFGTMLLGFGMAKSGFFHQPRQFSGLRKRLIVIGGVAGLACSYLFWLITTGFLELTPALLWLPFVIVAGMVLQSLCYVSAFVQLFQHPVIQRVLSIFEPVGRMALTNYLLQTAFYCLFFFSWTHGLRLYGKLTLTETYLLALLLFGGQVMISHWWLKRYQQGPVEAVWKALSYQLAQRRNRSTHNLSKVSTISIHSKVS